MKCERRLYEVSRRYILSASDGFFILSLCLEGWEIRMKIDQGNNLGF